MENLSQEEKDILLSYNENGLIKIIKSDQRTSIGTGKFPNEDPKNEAVYARALEKYLDALNTLKEKNLIRLDDSQSHSRMPTFFKLTTDGYNMVDFLKEIIE